MPGDRLRDHALVIRQANPNDVESAGLVSDAATFPEKLVLIANAYDGLIDSRERRVNPAQALEFLLLRSVLRDIPRDRDNHNVAVGRECAPVYLRPALRPIGSHIARLGAYTALPRGNHSLILVDELCSRFTEQLKRPLLLQLLTGVAELFTGRLVDVEQSHGLWIGQQDGFDRYVYCRAQSIYLLFGALAL